MAIATSEREPAVGGEQEVDVPVSVPIGEVDGVVVPGDPATRGGVCHRSSVGASELGDGQRDVHASGDAMSPVGPACCDYQVRRTVAVSVGVGGPRPGQPLASTPLHAPRYRTPASHTLLV